MQGNISAERAARYDAAVEQLKSFYRGEISAVEAYRQVMGSTYDQRFQAALRQNLASHQWRVQWLGQRIRELGGSTPTGSGPWGSFVKALETTATAIGQQASIAVLEEGEAHGVKDYRDDLPNLDGESERFVRELVLPKQIESHRVISNLKSFLRH